MMNDIPDPLDSAAPAMPGGSDVPNVPLIVGLTTLPSRIEHLRPTLDSLMAQTRTPDRILLCLPDWSRREQCVYTRPAWLADYAPVLEVTRCAHDWGPGTKLLGCLDRLVRPSCLVIADDDMTYRPSFLEGLYRSQLRDTAASFSYWTYACGPFDVGQGADGFSFHSPNLDGIGAFADRALRSAQLRVVDDLWISAFLKRRGVAVRSLQSRIPGGGTIYEPSHSLNQLHDLAGSLEREAAMVAGTRYLLEHGLLGPRLQTAALLKRALRGLRDAARRR